MEINGSTIQLGIIGDPIGHSFSPQMHNFISKYMGNNYIYSAFNVKPQDLSKAIEGIRALNIRGVNVTAPHKINVMQYLDEISPDAKILGSVNTVVNNNGVLTGYNTDSEGFYTSLVKAGITVKNSNILVMGCGGVCSASDVIEMMMAGATAVQVGAANLRNPYASKEIIEALPKEMERLGIERLRDIIGIVK